MRLAVILMQRDAPPGVQPMIEAGLDAWASFVARLPFLVVALVVLVLGWLLSRPVGRAMCRVRHGASRENLAEALSRLARAGLLTLTVLIAAVIAFPAFKPGDLVAGLGITSVAIGFAFKDILQNFFAGILILWREPFSVGDEIRSGDFEGVVEEINTRSTRIRTYDGERAVLPNGDVYTRPILVRTAYAHRRVTFTVGIGYADALEQARTVVFDVLARTEGVLQDPGPWVYVTELAPSSVNLTVYFWTASPQKNVLKVRDSVVTAIKLGFDNAGIDMPYPQTVVHFDDPYVFGQDGGQAASRDGKNSASQARTPQ